MLRTARSDLDVRADGFTDDVKDDDASGSGEPAVLGIYTRP